MVKYTKTQIVIWAIAGVLFFIFLLSILPSINKTAQTPPLDIRYTGIVSAIGESGDGFFATEKSNIYIDSHVLLVYGHHQMAIGKEYTIVVSYPYGNDGLTGNLITADIVQ